MIDALLAERDENMVELIAQTGALRGKIGSIAFADGAKFVAVRREICRFRIDSTQLFRFFNGNRLNQQRNASRFAHIAEVRQRSVIKIGVRRNQRAFSENAFMPLKIFG